jgi:DNA-binding GntR family transcriptional regulator
MQSKGFHVSAPQAANPLASGQSHVATLADDLFDRVSEEITSGNLPPGQRLDEHSLVRRFNVSRTPVREALRQLEASGLVERRPYKGAIVATVSSERLHEMFTAMGELEAACARQAALAMTIAERRALRAFHDSMAAIVRAGDTTEYSRANSLFHQAISKGAHNSLLVDIVHALQRRLAPFRQAQFRNAGRLVYSHAEHEGVVVAIEHGHAEAAAQGMREHMDLVNASFDKIVGNSSDG